MGYNLELSSKDSFYICKSTTLVFGSNGFLKYCDMNL